MRVLEFLAGLVIALLTSLILLVSLFFAVGSMGRYIKAKTM